jgi:hypothetical protein
MASRPGSRQLHPGLALLGAAVFHGLLLVLAWQKLPAGISPRPSLVPVTEVEVLDLNEPQREQPSPAAPALGLPRSLPALRAERAAKGSGNPIAPSLETGDEMTLPAPGASASPAPESFAERPKIDLGLDGSLTRQLLLKPPREQQNAGRPSVGLLKEGLDARDAARGLSRSSPAIQAAYRAAGQAPPDGLAVFDVRADASGNVVSVTLVSFGSNEERWRRVAGALQSQLKKRRLRVPPGSAGLLARLRIERGELSKDVADLDRQKRGVALGQDYLGPKDQREESTRSSLEPGKITPTAGGSIGGGGGTKTRVVLVSERVL